MTARGHNLQKKPDRAAAGPSQGGAAPSGGASAASGGSSRAAAGPSQGGAAPSGGASAASGGSSYRRSGVLLHPTSLPGPYGSGDLGASARHFIDWLATGGQTLWQVLPLGLTGPGNSPYMSPSAFAGNPLLVDLSALHGAGWLTDAEATPPEGFGTPSAARRVDFPAVRDFRHDRLRRAAARFFEGGATAGAAAQRKDFDRFCVEAAAWLDDFTLHAALAEQHGGDLAEWPSALRKREPGALADATRALGGSVAFHRFVQWCFDRQWRALRAYAKTRGVGIVGDVPIFVADNGVELWSRPELFDLGADGRPRVVAGVPPDYFSATGQRWGNPLYRWPAHASEGYRWWIARLRHALAQCDVVRIDHFRGFESYWEIPAAAETAIGGRWLPGPGEALFAALGQSLGQSLGQLLGGPQGKPLPLIAEDLGIITAKVRVLRAKLGLPGMRILQFAFDGKPENPYLPYNFERDTVVYTGTHDNDTTAGWWNGLDDTTRRRVADLLGRPVEEVAREPHWHLIRAAFASVAQTCIVPMQDALGLGCEARMNCPGEATGCWEWRFAWDQVGPRPADALRELARVHGRNAPEEPPGPGRT